MPYLSLSSIMSEMNAEENRAKGMLDLSTLNLPQSREPQEPDPELKDKPPPATPLEDILKLFGGVKQ